MGALGVPKTRKIWKNWPTSESPENKGRRLAISAQIHPTDQISKDNHIKRQKDENLNVEIL